MNERLQFQSTVWSRIQLVKKHDSRAVSEFVDRYRGPVLRFIERAGIAPADAEDLTQEVFVRLLGDEVLARADQEKGRLRSFLLGVTKNVVREDRRRRSAAKRGDALSLDGGSFPEPAAPESPDENFDRLWIAQLLSSALDELRRLNPAHHQTLEAFVRDGKDYPTIAREMGKPLQTVKNYIHRARQKLTDLLQREISRYASSAQEYEEEIQYLSRFLAPDGSLRRE